MSPLAPDPNASALARDPEVLASRLREAFPEAATAPGDIRVVHAPGRVNLIGEHTDYNLGFVLPVAIDLGIAIAVLPTDDRRVEITLAATGETLGFDLDAIGPKRGAWIDYIAGTAWAMAERGLPLQGFRGVLASDLPQGSGLSSSAALELASSLALSGGDVPDLDRMTLARIAQRAENGYVGVNCGLMDQFASALGEAGSALLLDCRSLDHRAIPMADPDLALVACHSGSPRKLETSAYNERRSQCEEAAAGILGGDVGLASLRDVTPAMLEAARGTLDPVVFARAEHIVHENDRVLATVAAFEAGDLATVGRLFYASHASMRDLFGISSPELDTLVEIASGVPGVIGARLTGAGFGGCTINLVRREAVPALREAVMRDYPARTGLAPRVFEVAASEGARRLR
ncbi:MAG: galactokinase [Chloroflexota bacterium]